MLKTLNHNHSDLTSLINLPSMFKVKTLSHLGRYLGNTYKVEQSNE